MDFIVAILMQLALLYLLSIWTARLLLPGKATEVALGMIARDVFWLVTAAIGAILVLPFRILAWLVAPSHPSRHRHRRRPRRRRRRW